MPGLVENSQVGKREDLSDIYSIADAKETPFISRVKKGSAPRNSEFDWLVDSYEAVSTGGVIDGTDVSAYENHAEDRGRIGNCVQIWRKASKVSRLSEELSVVAGVPSEIKLAVAKKLVELKRNMEATLLSSNAAQIDTGSVEYKTAGIGLFIDTTGLTVPRSIPAAYRTPTASINTTATASLAETDIQAVLTSIYSQTGMTGDYMWLMGTTLRRRVTEMTRFDDGGSTDGQNRVRNFNQSSSDTTITSTTEVYKGDYGKLSVVTSLFIGGDTYDIDRGYVLNMDDITFKSLVKPRAEYFEDQGGGKRFLLEAVGGLQLNNPLKHGKFQP